MATNLFFIDFNVFIYFVNLIKFYFTLKIVTTALVYSESASFP